MAGMEQEANNTLATGTPGVVTGSKVLSQLSWLTFRWLISDESAYDSQQGLEDSSQPQEVKQVNKVELPPFYVRAILFPIKTWVRIFYWIQKYLTPLSNSRNTSTPKEANTPSKRRTQISPKQRVHTGQSKSWLSSVGNSVYNFLSPKISTRVAKRKYSEMDENSDDEMGTEVLLGEIPIDYDSEYDPDYEPEEDQAAEDASDDSSAEEEEVGEEGEDIDLESLRAELNALEEELKENPQDGASVPQTPADQTETQAEKAGGGDGKKVGQPEEQGGQEADIAKQMNGEDQVASNKDLPVNGL